LPLAVNINAGRYNINTFYGDLNEIVKNIAFVFERIQEQLIIKQRNLKNDESGESIFSRIKMIGILVMVSK
jgi:hypothetical protein